MRTSSDAYHLVDGYGLNGNVLWKISCNSNSEIDAAIVKSGCHVHNCNAAQRNAYMWSFASQLPHQPRNACEVGILANTEIKKAI